jgi:molybdopterin converting factor small subunit
MPRVTVELFGVPRLRAGVASLTLEGTSVREVLLALGVRCPALEGTALHDGAPLPAYRVALNGDLAPVSPDRALRDGDVLLLMAAEAGG